MSTITKEVAHPDAGVDISLRIGQRVRAHQSHNRRRPSPVGVVRGLELDADGGLMVQVLLDAPIIIPASSGYSEISIWHQRWPAHEVAPLDESAQLVAELLRAAKQARDVLGHERMVVLASHFCEDGGDELPTDAEAELAPIDAAMAALDAAIAAATPEGQAAEVPA